MVSRLFFRNIPNKFGYIFSAWTRFQKLNLKELNFNWSFDKTKKFGADGHNV